jgi:Uma2 family endonuclease
MVDGQMKLAEDCRMSTATRTRATVDDLLRVEGKAELVGGRIVELMGTGLRPGRVSLRIARSLEDWAGATGIGVACPDNVIFAVPELPSGRESFSPDAAYYDGPMPADDMKPVPGPPTLAVEVRSDGDYGPAAERAMAAKRADYFAAGTEVVWDVDPVAELVHVYGADAPEVPTTYGRGHIAEAEPAVPGWRPLVDEFFPAR